jgi:hypothetical protein
MSYAYWEGQLYDFVTLSAYAPPYSWLAETDATGFAETEWEEEPTWDQGGEWDAEGLGREWEERAPPAPAPRRPSVPLSAAPEVGASQTAPRLTVYPEPGSTVSGIVDIVAAYVGPPAKFVVLTIDSHSEIIMNFPPYGYRWDTRDLEAGVHSVRVQVLGDGDVLLADQMTAYIVVPSQSDALELEVRDDL